MIIGRGSEATVEMEIIIDNEHIRYEALFWERVGGRRKYCQHELTS